VIVDLGTGDGRAVLAAAAADTRALVIGLDPDARAMAEASRRAARPPRKGGLLNVLFVVAAAERVPIELCGRADRVTVIFPWGSLLRGLLGADESVARGIAGLLRPAGCLEALISVTPRDGVGGLAALDEAAIQDASDSLARVGLELVTASRASAEEVRATRSSWGRRLLADADRPLWRLSFVRASRPPSAPCLPAT
jgi:16S rRNA (adenine(1408)-N(1))-methyltransferase